MRVKSEDISKIADGDEMVFTRFMEHYSTRLYYYAYGLLGQKEMAEEVVSVSFRGLEEQEWGWCRLNI